MTADKVAAAKWSTSKPIGDPAREQQVLETVTTRAKHLGLDPQMVERIFRGQIEANKVVQRGLHQAWDRDPSQRPTTRPNLDREVRPELDRISVTLLQAIEEARSFISSPQCPMLATAATDQVVVAMRLDDLHQQGLRQAVAATCPKAHAPH